MEKDIINIVQQEGIGHIVVEEGILLAVAYLLNVREYEQEASLLRNCCELRKYGVYEPLALGGVKIDQLALDNEHRERCILRAAVGNILILLFQRVAYAVDACKEPLVKLDIILV